MSVVFQGNLLELYRSHREEIDVLLDPIALFILLFVENVGEVGPGRLSHDIGISADLLSSKVEKLKLGQLLCESGERLATTLLGKRLLSEVGFLTRPQPIQQRDQATFNVERLRTPVSIFPGDFVFEQTGPTRRHEWQEIGFQEIPILQTAVAAGSPKPIKEDLAIGNVRAGSVVLVGEEQYVPVSLTDESAYLDLSSHFDYTAVQVEGISMDHAKPVGISDRDLVILRRPKGGAYVPMHGDIVAAVLPDIANETVILKRFYNIGSGIKLESETSQPDLPQHQPREFFRSAEYDDLPVRFVGQAIAVLKPAR